MDCEHQRTCRAKNGWWKKAMNILITGAEGLLGSNLCVLYSAGHTVYATGRNFPSINRCINLNLDILSPSDICQIVQIRPNLVIHCAALTNVDYCEEYPDDAWKVNVEGAKNVMIASQLSQSNFVHISTDAVFDGKKGGYDESDEPKPLNVYGKTKHEAEKIILATMPSATVIRTNIYGWNRKQKHSLAEWMLYNLENGISFQAITDLFFSPLLVNNLADALLEIHSVQYHGLLHIAGECCSKFQFAESIAEIFKMDPSLIRQAMMDEIPFKAPRAKNMCLNAKKSAALLKTKVYSIREGLLQFRSLREQGYINELRATA